MDINMKSLIPPDIHEVHLITIQRSLVSKDRSQYNLCERGGGALMQVLN